MSKKILVIDDEKNIRKSLNMILSAEGFAMFEAQDLKQATEILEQESILLYLVDVMLPDGDGIGFIKNIRDAQPQAKIIMISGHASVKMALEATRKGADDFLEKPLSRDKLLITLNNFLKHLELEEKYTQLENFRSPMTIIGSSPALREIIKTAEKIAPNNSKVLITGESGTGKEVIASLLHRKSLRKNKPFIKINCAAIPEELIEAELFGAEKGAYTGANERRDGKFLQADGGTLFLDEIGDMSLKTQTKVLRVLQDGAFERVGGSETLHTDVRIVAATNKDLQEQVRAGKFREDLYFRLHVVPLHLPPLKERKEDIKELAEYFLALFSRENNRAPLTVSPQVMERLIGYNWPGNIRELKNLVERMVILADTDSNEITDLPQDFRLQAFDAGRAFGQKKSLKDVREKTEAEYITHCLEKFGGNIARAAEFLEVDRTYLYKKVKKLGMEL